jgi:hypothetical protein
MHVSNYLALVQQSERELADALMQVCRQHKDEPDIEEECKQLAEWSTQHAEELEEFRSRYGEHEGGEPKGLHNALFKGPRSGGLGLLRDLHDLYLMATEAHISWVVLDQAAKCLRDDQLERAIRRMSHESERQVSWLQTRMKAAAPQALVAAK